mmetsp:Transcript_6516/g.17718  ORF Transcript_6516/g.17718 Transcript_6516/m.17718 type:complete len:90 (+) Transcript_6516:638-907(+)
MNDMRCNILKGTWRLRGESWIELPQVCKYVWWNTRIVAWYIGDALTNHGEEKGKPSCAAGGEQTKHECGFHVADMKGKDRAADSGLRIR